MRIILLSIISLLPTVLWAQKVKPCDIAIVVNAQQKLGKLRAYEIKKFLYTIDKSCDSNVEFSEASNELLFNVMDAHTKIVMRLLERDSRIQLNTILEKLSHSLLDNVNVPDLISKVEKTKVDESLKEHVITVLQTSTKQ